MSASLLKEAYVYMATTADDINPLACFNKKAKYPISRMRLSQQAERYIQKYGICVKIGSTTSHPSSRAYGIEGEKGVIMVKVQTLQTTQSGLLLIESLLRKQLEAHPCTNQVGTDTFQVFTDSNRELILSKWEEWIDKAIKIASMIEGA